MIILFLLLNKLIIKPARAGARDHLKIIVFGPNGGPSQPPQFDREEDGPTGLQKFPSFRAHWPMDLRNRTQNEVFLTKTAKSLFCLLLHSKGRQ
jgi:hypothetical protein